MGNNPSKTHQLQSAFPQFRILSDLSLSSDNKYELIFVGKEGQKEVYAIKETLKQPALLNYLKTVQPQVRTYGDINKCSQVLQILECKKIDSMFYTLYQWLPISLPNFLASTSEPPSRSLCIYIMLTLLKVYAMLWKNCEGCGLDIAPHNIRVVNNISLQNSLPSIKVLPPSITHSFSKKQSLNNSIKHLGDVFAVLLSRGRHISDLMTFVNQRMRSPGVSTTLVAWEELERDSLMFTQLHRPSLTPVKRDQQGRSVSPIFQNQKLSPLPLQPGHIATITRPVSPISISRITYSRNLSPQHSRISTQKSQYQTQNNIKPTQNIYRTSVSPVKFVHQVDQLHSPLNMQTFNNANNLHQHHEPLTLHQRYPSEQGSTLSYNYSSSTPNTNKFIPISPHNMKSQIYQTTILDPQRELASLKLTSPSPSLVSPSPFCYDKHIVTNSKVGNHFGNENGNGVSNFTIQYPSHSHSETKISTPRQRNFNITNNPIKTIKPVSPTKNTQNLQLQNNPSIGLTSKAQVIETKKQINSSFSIPSMFTPSLPDSIQIRSKIGVPSFEYIPKTTQDKHDESEQKEQKEQKKESCKSSLNLFGSAEDFIEKHLMTKNKSPQTQLLCSSIPVVIDKESSFGLTVSEDSDSGINYEGVYEGSFHSNFPTIKHGVGKLIFPSGGSYHGNFSWNKMDGWGKLFYPSGRLAYEGYWKNSKFQGYGKLFNENPMHIDFFDYQDFNKAQIETEDGYWKYYEGNMKNDMKEGHGVWVMENGQKYDGQFHLDMVHGIGIFYGKKCNIEGTWENNYFMKG